ncbi:hypothetical protein EXE30_08045 [Acinetobacter halotolerans]|uniref:Lipoprotein n=1 Tax=Acinetobacter halotolerans TaxID=1752076 RepID=A0A4Q6XJY3_9GAMM|nr:hypothetical protein [Acinetobacter halotolerans]RZF53067.1 hypothetical protein EXE30_08045 [Acinetobacter halotolerans]
MKKLAYSLGLSLIFLAGCSSVAYKGDMKTHQSDAVTIEFVGNGTYSVPQQQGTVSLYAVEKRMADVPATLIQQKKVQVSQVPFTVDFTVPADHKKLIQPTVRGDAEITYYVTWESATQNLTGKDAIVIDYDRKFPRVKLGSGKQQIYLR